MDGVPAPTFEHLTKPKSHSLYVPEHLSTFAVFKSRWIRCLLCK